MRYILLVSMIAVVLIACGTASTTVAGKSAAGAQDAGEFKCPPADKRPDLPEYFQRLNQYWHLVGQKQGTRVLDDGRILSCQEYILSQGTGSVNVDLFSATRVAALKIQCGSMASARPGGTHEVFYDDAQWPIRYLLIYGTACTPVGRACMIYTPEPIDCLE